MTDVVWSPQPPPAPVLTGRQLEVLRLAATGHSSSAMAAQLGLSVDTVKSHLRRLYGRLGVRDRAHAVHVAHQRGLL